MTDAGALVKFGGKYREEIESTNSKEVIDSVTMDGELYGVPFTTNTWFMSVSYTHLDVYKRQGL